MAALLTEETWLESLRTSKTVQRYSSFLEDASRFWNAEGYTKLKTLRMQIWQADFYRRPLQNEIGQPLWELIVCDPAGTPILETSCPQTTANSAWLVEQLQQASHSNSALPEKIQVFRPQCLSLFEIACQKLGIKLEPIRHTTALKQHLQNCAAQYPQMKGYTGEAYQPINLEKPPPIPLSETLWGEQWRFAALPAGELVSAFAERPIPVLEMPDRLLPMNLQLASTLPIPGTIVDGGRQSMRLVRWLQEVRPVSLNYVPGQPDGLILEAGLVDRWIIATFEDPEATAAAKTYEQRKRQSQGLHFLLVQPDNSGITYSGFWLLNADL